MKKDYSDDIECYNSCPHCGKKNLGFQTSLDVINYMKQEQIPLAGAVHDFTCPKTGKNYMVFPIRAI